MAGRLDEIDDFLFPVDSELGVDIAEVHLHGVARECEPLFHKGEIAPLSQLHEHLLFPARQTPRAGKLGAGIFSKVLRARGLRSSVFHRGG